MAAPIVKVQQGELRGAIRDNIDGGQYFSFRGIPYAEPPVGELRFKEPEPLKLWSGVRDAVDESKTSAQYEIRENNKEGGDDCLYLNIATNSLTEKRPVLVWIHGGAFRRHSNSYTRYSPDYLLKKDIVFVGINYRLGVLGFLNMEHEECAGNQGLKDQVTALKWIQDNIHIFGGDPKNVTIFGQSAGGASVHALCLSPRAKGLFHKAIMSSGAMSCPWAFIASNKEDGYTLAEALGKKCTNSIEVIEFLRTFPAITLVEKYEILNEKNRVNQLFYLVPTSDNESLNPILPRPISEMLKNGIDVPLLIGYNSHEGILRFIHGTPNFVKEINDNFELEIAKSLRMSDPKKISETAKAVYKFYFGEDEINERTINELVQYIGDMMFISGIHRAVDFQLQKTTPTYFYKFSYQPDFPLPDNRIKLKIEGTNHSDDILFLFFSQLKIKFKIGTRDRLVMERMTAMWTNFVKFGDPTPFTDDIITTKWLPVEKNKKHYLEINENLTSSENPDTAMWEMWKPFRYPE